MTTPYDDLARLAGAATPGDWLQQRDTVKLGRRNIATAYSGVPLGLGESYRQGCANAAYIAAANPATIKGLLADRDALAEAASDLLNAVTNPVNSLVTKRGAVTKARAALARVKEGA